MPAPLYDAHGNEVDMEGYFCVFTGRPSLCTPYALFASLKQADLFASAMGSRHEILTLRGWRGQYAPRTFEQQAADEAEPFGAAD